MTNSTSINTTRGPNEINSRSLRWRDANAAARLIAAAPDMLEVLKRWTYDGALQTYEDRERFRKAARAAIAKAEGPS
jgi:hypothetical protein